MSRREIDLVWSLQLVIFAVLVSLMVTVTSVAAQDQGTGHPHTVTIRMKDFKFVPATVTVTPGDTVRWVNTTNTPHDVKFTGEPSGGQLASRDFPAIAASSRTVYDRKGPPPEVSPFLVSQGATYQLVIDPQYFPAGTYSYVCMPHQSFGMKGKIIVQGQVPSSSVAENH